MDYQIVEVKLIGLNLKSLFYKVNFNIARLDIIEVEIKNTKKRLALVIEVYKNLDLDFEVKEAMASQFSLTDTQKILLNFISEYYLCDIGISLDIFTLFNTSFLQKTDKSQAKDVNKLKDLSTNRNLDSKYTKNINNLSLEQKNILDNILQNISKNINLNLLFGDTGSGKTEIYIHIMQKYLNKQILFLMPEISLTPQIELRLKKVFKNIGIWHSLKTKKQKEKILQDLIEGKINIIAGARSALFLPFNNLGLIIVDEEHDSSYKSSSNPKYNAKDIAIFLSIKNIAVVLGSATPSPTSYNIVKNQHSGLGLLRLKNNFFNTQRHIIQDKDSGLSKMLKDQIIKALDEKKQVMIFIPTRANFKSLVCNTCGNTIKCPNCSVSLSLHRNKNALICHYCNYSKIAKLECGCGGEFKGVRIGTQEFKIQLEKFLEKYYLKRDFSNNTLESKKESLGLREYPNLALLNSKNATNLESKNIVTIEIFDRDNVGTQKKLEYILNNFSSGKIDILIGTQMITKGHDYPDVGLSAIIDIDFFLNMQSFNAAFNAYSLIYQVAGRAGRRNGGVFLLQSKREEILENINCDFEDILEAELEYRQNLYPPFCKIALIKISHKDHESARKFVNAAYNFLKTLDIFEFELVGFSQAQIFRIKHIYSYQIFLRSKKKLELQKVLKYLLIHIDPELKKVIDIDIDSLLV